MKTLFDDKMSVERKFGDDIIKHKEVCQLNSVIVRDFLEISEIDYAKLNGWKDSNVVDIQNNNHEEKN